MSYCHFPPPCLRWLFNFALAERCALNLEDVFLSEAKFSKSAFSSAREPQLLFGKCCCRRSAAKGESLDRGRNRKIYRHCEQGASQRIENQPGRHRVHREFLARFFFFFFNFSYLPDLTGMCGKCLDFCRILVLALDGLYIGELHHVLDHVFF